jgi:hypothetical protein
MHCAVEPAAGVNLPPRRLTDDVVVLVGNVEEFFGSHRGSGPIGSGVRKKV